MTDLTRRHAVKLLAGGSVLASGSLPGAAPIASGAPSAPPVSAIPEAVWQVATSATPAAQSPVLLARVARCRSWDGSVYLAAPGLCGYAQLAPHAFAIAAACQAADRPVAMRHGGHDPRWGDGSGRFHGVILAIDARDFIPAGATHPADAPWE